MFDKLLSSLRKEAVLIGAFVCAAASFPFAGDVSRIPGYIDWRVIVLMFCLMASVAGASESGAVYRAASALVSGRRTKRFVCLVLVLMPFFTSMFVTNDVALLTFVPLALFALQAAGWRDVRARVVVLQAIAANLGGMLTPFGNPQNLFIFTKYDIGVADFFWALFPFAALALLLLVVACVGLGNDCAHTTLDCASIEHEAVAWRYFLLHVALFLLSVCAVVRLISWYVLPVVVVPVLLVFDRRVFLRVDWSLLATFVCFFVFSGNVSHVSVLQDFLGGLMQNHPMLTSLCASQIMSNVPAAVLLAEFTTNWHSLLIGVDLGGLGTPIASLASLIAYRLYKASEGSNTRTFMVEFGLANAVVLAFMVALYAVLHVL